MNMKLEGDTLARVSALSVLTGVDRIYNDGSTANLQDIKGVAYTVYNPELGHRGIFINEKFSCDLDIIRALVHHEHGHVAYTIVPSEALLDPVKKNIHNLLEDIRLECLISTIFPAMSPRFHRVAMEVMIMGTIPSGSKYAKLLQQLFSLRFVQHIHNNLTLVSYPDKEIEEILQLLITSLVEYKDAYPDFIYSFQTAKMEFDKSITKKATRSYVKAIKKCFELIDNETPPQGQMPMIDRIGKQHYPLQPQEDQDDQNGSPVVVLVPDDESEDSSQDDSPDTELPQDQSSQEESKEDNFSGDEESSKQSEDKTEEEGTDKQDGSGQSDSEEEKDEDDSSSGDKSGKEETEKDTELEDEGGMGTGSDSDEKEESKEEEEDGSGKDDVFDPGGDKSQEDSSEGGEDDDQDEDIGDSAGGAGSSEGFIDCTDAGTPTIPLADMEDAIIEKIEEQMEKIEESFDDPVAWDISAGMQKVNKHGKDCKCHPGKIDQKFLNIDTSQYRRTVPNQLSRVLFDGRRHTRVEKSALRMDSAPITGSGRKYLQVKYKDFHFTIELCLDISGSVDIYRLKREWLVAASLFETFKHVADIRLSAFSDDYYLIEENATKMPMKETFRYYGKKGGTNLFESVNRALEDILPYKTLVFVAITDGEAATPQCDGLRGRGIARGFLRQIQTKNRFVVVIPVIPLEKNYMQLFGKYAVMATVSRLEDPFVMQEIINNFANLLVDLYRGV